MNPEVWGYLSLVSLKVRLSTPGCPSGSLLYSWEQSQSHLVTEHWLPVLSRWKTPFRFSFEIHSMDLNHKNPLRLSWLNGPEACLPICLFLFDGQTIGSRAVIQVCCEGTLPHCSVHLLGKQDTSDISESLVNCRWFLNTRFVYLCFPPPSWTCRTSRSSGRLKSYRTS